MAAHRLATNISCHAFNGDKSMMAVCPNNNQVHIYKKSGSSWTRTAVLKEHDKPITGIDWAPKSNRIVTCSEDRNAFVWAEESPNVWKPTLVLLRVNRAATAVRWSPQETKFAVASGSKVVSVCYFEEDNNWWVSKHLKKHRSTVLSISWHPDGLLLATGSSDYKARVFSTFIKGVDTKPDSSLWGDNFAFGNILCEFDSLAWVHDVAFSPSGNRLAWSGHNSTLGVADGPSDVKEARLRGLPLASIVFLNEDTIIGGGWDCEPFVLTAGKGWNVERTLDKKATSTASTSVAGKWKERVSKGTTDESLTNTVLKTVHQNAITQVRVLGTAEFSTCGLDGNIVFWKL